MRPDIPSRFDSLIDSGRSRTEWGGAARDLAGEPGKRAGVDAIALAVIGADEPKLARVGHENLGEWVPTSSTTRLLANATSRTVPDTSQVGDEAPADRHLSGRYI